MTKASDTLEKACGGLPYTSRAMFGGHGLFAPNGGIFAAAIDDRVVLKLVDTPLRDKLFALGGSTWVYIDKKGSTAMKEWIVVPPQFHDDPARLAEWCARAHATAPPKGVAKAAKKDVARKARANRR